MEAIPPMIPTNKANMSVFNPPCQWNPIRTAIIKRMTTCTAAMRDHGNNPPNNKSKDVMLDSLSRAKVPFPPPWLKRKPQWWLEVKLQIQSFPELKSQMW